MDSKQLCVQTRVWKFNQNESNACINGFNSISYRPFGSYIASQTQQVRFMADITLYYMVSVAAYNKHNVILM